MARYSPTHPRSWALYARCAGLAVALLLLLAACAPAPTARPTPSPTATPPGDARTVYVGADGVYALRPSDGALRWRYAAGPHAVAFVADTVVGGSVVATLGDGAVVALDARSGAVRWRHQEAGRQFGLPLAAGGGVYAVFSRPGAADPRADSVAALDARDGSFRWEFKTGDNLLVAPTFGDGVVYAGSTDTYLYALRASDGALLWRHRLYDLAGGGVAPRAAEADGLVYVGAGAYAGQGDPKNPVSTWRNYLAALRAADGAEVWRYQVNTGVEGAVVEPVAAAGGVVYASVLGGDVDALDARTGALAWRAHPDQAIGLTAPTLAGGTLYVETQVGRAFAGELYALRAGDGAILWHAPTSSSGIRLSMRPAVADGAVYAPSCDYCGEAFSEPNPPGSLGAYDAATGAARWSYKTKLLPLAIVVGGP